MCTEQEGKLIDKRVIRIRDKADEIFRNKRENWDTYTDDGG